MSDDSTLQIDLSRNPELLDVRRAHVLVIDVQEKLLPVIQQNDAVVNSISFLLNCCRLLGVPVIVSEQYPKGLGSTIDAIAQHEAISQRFEKLRFSAADEFCKLVDAESGMARDTTEERDQVLLVGIETHICVQQTALDLLGRGYRVYVATDAVGSRHRDDHEEAVNRQRDNGVSTVTAESAVFEMTETAESPVFREISRLVRDRQR